MRKTKLLIIFIAVSFNAVMWSFFNRPDDSEPSWTGVINMVSFSPYRQGQDPTKERFPSHEEIWDDLEFLNGKTAGIRTYSSIDGMEVIPGLAARLGMNVTAGAWLDGRQDRNEAEINNLIVNANRYPGAIKRVIVGNEAFLRGDLTAEQLIDYMERVRRAVSCPVGTAEPWHVWIKHPELAEHSDFLAIHVLPYWEKVPLEKSVGWVLDRYRQVKEAFPDKPVFIGEAGWPSAGEHRGRSTASKSNAAIFLRRFLTIAEHRNLDYCIMEAFDQPWKKPYEGVVGAFWGVFDVERQNKLSFTGPIQACTIWLYQLVAVLAGFILGWIYLRKRGQQPIGGQLFFALLLQAAVSVLIWILVTPLIAEFLPGEIAVWAFLLPMQLGLLMVILINGFEMSEMLWPQGLKRRFGPRQPEIGRNLPKVSIHVPICKEPPAMVIETLDSLAALDYPAYEVLVVDNNNPHAELWRPVQAHCRKLGEKFRFFHLETHPGYKAGALNFALGQTAADADIVGVIDSDYVVRADWLQSLIAHFETPGVGVVQAPQDHRNWADSLFKEMCNWEYQGFFEIGMVQRNERNALIQHGTMTLIRKAALIASGGWGEWCICEDAELGLRIINLGYEVIYVKESFGQGLSPESFAGYKHQRFRWVYGAVQILKRHWSILAPWSRSGRLTFGQRYHFIAGWLPWFADAVNCLMSVVCLVWALGMLVLPSYFGAPLYMLLLPPIGAFAFKLCHFLWLYQARVPCSVARRIGAALAGTALTHTIGTAIISGLFTSGRPFMRTAKCESRSAVLQGLMMARGEAMMGTLLALSAGMLTVFGDLDDTERLTWSVLLLIQSLPYMAALVLSIASVMPDILPGPLKAGHSKRRLLPRKPGMV
jgi:exo-beta-1,3-glucanase (GH17 family)/cellulose synthase/poly-beta-1,6-N-acetylglucosamine synthase-like glycosyltransferase